jgi:tetratricopeptide (TPR) repeat protein
MKQSLIIFSFLSLSYLSSAQTINHLPEYGHTLKSKELLKADSLFIKSESKKYGNRKKASQRYTDLGWHYFQKGINDTAMFRFNQAWLLDSLNAGAQYGFAVLEGKQQKFKESLKYFEKSNALNPTAQKFLPDWALSLLNVYEIEQDQKYVDKAEQVLDKFLKKDTTYAYAYNLRAVCSFYKKDYPQAWVYIHKCRLLSERQINNDLLKGLLSVSDDPKGIYKAKNKQTQ